MSWNAKQILFLIKMKIRGGISMNDNKTMDELILNLREAGQAFADSVTELQKIMIERGFTTWEAIEEARGKS